MKWIFSEKVTFLLSPSFSLSRRRIVIAFAQIRVERNAVEMGVINCRKMQKRRVNF